MNYLTNARQQKIKYATLLLVALAFVVGVAIGAAVQRSIGVGNVLRDIGIPYPTRTPIPTPTPSLSADIIDNGHRGKLALFILAGQSNMSGIGPVPSDAPDPSPQIYLFGNDYRWHIAQEPIDAATDQVDRVSIDVWAGYSPGLAFATELFTHDPDLLIGLIPCAKSSSSISQWQRNLSDDSLYGSCIKRARAASTMGEVAGILFFQGEADAVDPILSLELNPQPHRWAEQFTRLVADFRNDLSNPMLPVVFAQIGSYVEPEAFPEWEIVQAQQASVQLPMVAMIQTGDLALQDNVHFSAQSYQIIGTRFAEAYWHLLNESDQN